MDVIYQAEGQKASRPRQRAEFQSSGPGRLRPRMILPAPIPSAIARDVRVARRHEVNQIYGSDYLGATATFLTSRVLGIPNVTSLYGPFHLNPHRRRVGWRRGKQAACVWPTDPDARVMRIGKSDFRQAYEILFSSDTGSQARIGVSANAAGNHQGELVPTVDQIELR